MRATAGLGSSCSSAARSPWAATCSASRTRVSVLSSASSANRSMNNPARFRMRITSFAAAVVAAALAPTASAEIFVDMGANDTNIQADIAGLTEIVETDAGGLHLGVGFRRELTQGSIGARLEFD